MNDFSKASTGIAALDDVLGGGLPSNHLYLLEGDPGTGKTTIALQFLLAGVARGEVALYVTLSETADELRASAASHGGNLDGIQIYEFIEEGSLVSDAQYTVFISHGVIASNSSRASTDHRDVVEPGDLARQQELRTLLACWRRASASSFMAPTRTRRVRWQQDTTTTS